MNTMSETTRERTKHITSTVSKLNTKKRCAHLRDFRLSHHSHTQMWLLQRQSCTWQTGGRPFQSRQRCWGYSNTPRWTIWAENKGNGSKADCVLVGCTRLRFDITTALTLLKLSRRWHDDKTCNNEHEPLAQLGIRGQCGQASWAAACFSVTRLPQMKAMPMKAAQLKKNKFAFHTKLSPVSGWVVTAMFRSGSIMIGIPQIHSTSKNAATHASGSSPMNGCLMWGTK